MSRDERHNFIFSTLYDTLYTLAIMFTSGTLLQTFLSHYGVSAALIGVYTALLSVIEIACTVLLSHLADNKGNVKKSITFITVTMASAVIGLPMLCLFGNVPYYVALAVVFVTGCIQGALGALRNMYSYKLPYLILELKHYGLFVAVKTSVGGAASIGVSALLSYLMATMDYLTVMFGGFICSMALYLLAAFCNSRLRLKNDSKEAEGTQTKNSPLAAFLSLIRMPLFNRLILPSVLRGFATGVLALAATMALKLGFSEADTALMITISSVASIGGALFFGFISRKADPKALCLVGSLIVALFPLMSIGGRWVFLGGYLIVVCGKIIVDLSIPTFLYLYVPYEISGEYHAWRLMLGSAGGVLASVITGFMLDNLPVIYLLVIAAVAQAASGFLFYFSPVLKNECRLANIKND